MESSHPWTPWKSPFDKTCSYALLFLYSTSVDWVNASNIIGHQFWQLDASHFHTCFLPNVFSLNESWLFTHRKIVISYDEQANPTVWVVNICWSYFKNHRKLMVLMILGWKTSINRGTNWSWSWGSHWMARCDLWPEGQQSKRSWDLTALKYESDSEGNARRCTIPIIFSLV